MERRLRPYKPTKLLYQDAGDGVFLITLHDPKRLNCMSLNLVQEAARIVLALWRPGNSGDCHWARISGLNTAALLRSLYSNAFE